MRRRHSWGIATAVALVALAGCHSSAKSTGSSHPLGDAGLTAVDVIAQAGVFQQPLDAAPSPDGSTMFWIATASQGPAVFSAPAAGGAPTVVTQGAPLAQPTGIAVATDGSHLYLADQTATQAGNTAGPGAILSVSTSGSANAATVLPGTEGRAPRGIDIVNQGDSDVIYFTGIDPADGATGVFQVSTAGGTVTTLAEGAPFVATDSVVVSTQGVAYVTDDGTGTGQGRVFQVTGGTVKAVAQGLDLGHPAGVTLINTDATLLVSALDPASLSDEVLFVDLATGRQAAATKVIGAHKSSAGGLHRAHTAKVLGWADTVGTVYRVRYP